MKVYEIVDGMIRVYECEAKKEELEQKRRELLEQYHENHPKFMRVETTSDLVKDCLISGKNVCISGHDDPLNNVFCDLYPLKSRTRVEKMLERYLLEKYINGMTKKQKISRTYRIKGNGELVYDANYMNLGKLEEYSLENKKIYVFQNLLRLPDSLCALEYFEQEDYTFLALQEDNLYEKIPFSLYKDSLRESESLIREYSYDLLFCPLFDKVKELKVSSMILNRIKDTK